MQSIYGDRETVGSQIIKSHEQHVNEVPPPSQDIGFEAGKSYMDNIWEIVEQHEKIVDRFYIQVISIREVYRSGREISLRFVARNTRPGMEPDIDVWHVDNKRGELRLLWSLPPYKDMNYILQNSSEFDSDRVHWVSIYKDAEKQSKSKSFLKV